MQPMLKMKRKFLLLVTAGIVAVSVPAYSSKNEVVKSEQSIDKPCCGPITAVGQKILSVLDNSNVEHLWLNHQYVNWETGKQDNSGDYSGHGNHSHCSAFSAAIGERLGVYMLRPPEHSQILLASAQTKWFNTIEGRKAGWRNVADPVRAQQLANEGFLVVISYKSPNPHTPGHIVIVRPSLISLTALEMNGPKITQAGTKNLLEGNASVAFASHPGAWPNGVKYFVHDVPK